jgi:NADPH:quinone reductase-like Zn-dependent oxidoreductase
MRAIRFKSFGDPTVLELAEVAVPAFAETMALVRVMAASINPSDVKNVAGAMKQTTLPRIPGRDFAGVVEAGPAEWIGAAVWGTGGDTGFTRDGTHSGMIAVPVASAYAASPIPSASTRRRPSESTTWQPGVVSKRQDLGPVRRFFSLAPAAASGEPRRRSPGDWAPV